MLCMLGYVVRSVVRAAIPLCLKGSEKKKKKAQLVAADSRAFSGVCFVLCSVLVCFSTASELRFRNLSLSHKSGFYFVDIHLLARLLQNKTPEGFSSSFFK